MRNQSVTSTCHSGQGTDPVLSVSGRPWALWVGAPSKAPLAVALAGAWYLEGEADPARVRRRQRRSQLLWDVIQAERRGARPASAQSLRPRALWPLRQRETPAELPVGSGA